MTLVGLAAGKSIRFVWAHARGANKLTQRVNQTEKEGFMLKGKMEGIVTRETCPKHEQRTNCFVPGNFANCWERTFHLCC